MSKIPGDSQAEAISPIHRIFHTSQSDIVRLGRRIGTGAEGEVYETQDNSDLVAKVYHEPPPKEKAEKLVALSRLGNERLFNLSAWPVSTLRDAPDGEVVGFVMKKISQAEEVHALHSPKSRLQKFPEASWAFLIYVAANIARAVALIHEHGLVIGDVNPKNILVTRKATVYLLDVDSFQVAADGKTYRCEGGFPEYTPPELQGIAFRDVDRVQEHDCFGLAVVIFQLLFMGRHPFSGMYLGAEEMPLERAIRESRFAYGADVEARKMGQPPGTLALDSMPPPLVDLFRRAFLTADRPLAREWIEHLDALAKALKKCDLHSGHYYYSELRDCPWCGIESQAGVRLFNFLFSGDESRRGHFRLDEIWEEITSVEAPHIPQIQWDKISKPSAEIAAFAKARKSRLKIAIICSAFAGLSITLLVDGPHNLFLLILVGLIANAIVRINASSLENIRARQRLAKEEAQRLQEQYHRKSGNERWGAKLDELRNQKETYENLAQFRQLRLQQLEPEARKYQLEEFLDQFKINDAEIRRIVPSAKKVLLSQGIETAADVGEINKINNLMRIPSIGSWLAGWLVEWRRDLEQRFVFNPAGGVPPEARVRVEREVDALRLRLESELSGGARRLRRMKQEIEARGRMLQPALSQAHRELAQAKKDLAVAGKHSSTAPILAAVIISFIIGLAIKTNTKRLPLPGPIPSTVHEAAADWESAEKASRLYREGAQLLLEQRFEKAVVALQEVVRIDPKHSDAYEKLGYALYRLKRYDESLEASEKAIGLRGNFGPYYNSGLAYMELGRLERAKMSFESAVTNIRYSWEERYTLAYYYLGSSKARLGEATQSIELLEAILKGDPGLTVKRLELASLYLWVGKREAARAQYKILKDSNPALAEELSKLILLKSIKTRG
jgi:DNA-binding helix-hairpin-helix protein with protein kinase domain/Tfp pilus assembly protein PilF